MRAGAARNLRSVRCAAKTLRMGGQGEELDAVYPHCVAGGAQRRTALRHPRDGSFL